ncbi:MAG: hypothetical protein HYZ42_05125 [Bacteroidetes bacterium]|nr:hypothetical protein [Bacteroidota bacterium]
MKYYTNYTNLWMPVLRGEKLVIGVDGGVKKRACVYSIFIDWNQNGFFDSYEIYTVSNNGLGSQWSNITINVSSTTPKGKTGMRVLRNQWGVGAAGGGIGDGEIEDFMLDVRDYVYDLSVAY